MRRLLLLGFMLCLGRATSAEPNVSAFDELLQGAPCDAPEITIKMPQARLGKVFETLQRLACGVRFDVDEDVAKLVTDIDIRNVPPSTFLDVLASNHRLIYTVENGRLRVSRQARPARGPKMRLALSMRENASAPAKPTMPFTTLMGGCGTVMSLGSGRASLLRLDTQGASLRPSRVGAREVRVRLCANKDSDGSLGLVGEVFTREVLDDGYRSREERTVFKRTAKAGEKDVSLYKDANGFELTLLDHEIEAPLTPR
jgi:hypothetical protein